MSQAPSRYIHGTEPDEQRRLSLLNDILNLGSLRELALAGGESILDLGCGLGQFTRRMARAAGPTSRVVGVDRSSEQLAQARRLADDEGEGDRVDFREGDVLALELSDSEWGSFDVVHTRFVLEHVPDPIRVVRTMVRAARPGGRVVLEDEDHEILRLWPEPMGFDAMWGAYIESYVRHGNDPSVGRRLIALLDEAGARPLRSGAVWFGSSAGDPSFPSWVENLRGVMRGARDEILASDRVDAAGFDATMNALEAWGRRRDAAAWYFMAYAEGVRPA